MMRSADRRRLCAGMVALCAAGCMRHAVIDADLDRIAIYSLSWGRHAPLSMTPRRIMEAEDALFVPVTDAEFLRAVGARVREISSAPRVDRDHIDGRVLCLLHRTDARSDTLTFGRFYMAYNGGYHRTDTVLLRLIGSRLPEGSRRTIERIIDTMRSPGE